MPDILGIGKSGLMTTTKSLETTGHNISNANTEGYSRQRVMQEANAPVNKGGMVQGTGVRVKGIERVHDEFVEKRLGQQTSKNSYDKEKSSQLKQVENVFNEIDSKGLSKVLTKFFNSFRQLANQPENETIRSVVREKAELVTSDFKKMRDSLDRISRNIDKNIEREVEDINQLTDGITKLNKKIAMLEGIGDETGDLRDQRDMLVRELSKSFEVHTYTDGRNNYIVSAKGVGTLVSAGQNQTLRVGTQSAEKSSNGMPGSVEVYFESRPSKSISKNFKGGRLSSMIDVRNQNISGLQEHVDQVAYEFAKSVNAIHRKGFIHNPQTSGPRGPAGKNSGGAVTGIDFFKEPESIKGAASKLTLSDAIKDDAKNIATAMDPNSPGDNRIAVAISKVQDERFMEGGSATIEESYLKAIGNIGLEAGKAQLNSEQSEGVLAQLNNLRERISGVNLDEETANMVKFQHAYNASAKVIQTADEMFQTVLGMKR